MSIFCEIFGEESKRGRFVLLDEYVGTQAGSKK